MAMKASTCKMLLSATTALLATCSPTLAASSWALATPANHITSDFHLLAPSSMANTTTTTTTNVVSTVALRRAGCSGVATCLDDPQCAQCLDAINSTAGFPHTRAEFSSLDRAAIRAYHLDFFRILRSTESCSTNATLPLILYPALQELGTNNSCINAYGMETSPCLVAEYTCFVAADHCRDCLTTLYDALDGSNITKATAAGSPACTTANQILIVDLASSCTGTFPTCTYAKQQCALQSDCESCMAKLRRGDGAGAARECPVTQKYGFLASEVVGACMASEDAACDFWLQRCADNAKCSACLDGMSDGLTDNARAIVADLSSPACRTAMQDLNLAHLFLQSITNACPGISTCRHTITNCVVNNGEACLACVNGSAPPSQATFCSELSRQYSFDTECQPCPASVHTVNVLVTATAVVGGAASAACVTVAATVVAHGRDRVSMRARIVVGLMMANAVYSTSNAIPLNALRTGVLDCGRLAMSFDAIRFGRAWWFCGKYGLVGFELFILGASIRALHRGVSADVSRCAEMVLHTLCCAIAALAFGVFYTLCASINAEGYNERMEDEVYTNAFNHANKDDDFDDEAPSIAASMVFQRSRDSYDNLVHNMLVVWNGVVGIAVVLWIVLRALYMYALQTLRTEAAAAAKAEANDEWIATRRSAWKARRRLLEARRDSFNEVATPLEPYIFVFVLFAAPAFVMSTSFCESHSGASSFGSANVDAGLGGGSTNVYYGTCYAWCEFFLAFRSLGTVAVYLVPRERRYEFVAICSTLRKLCTRVVGCICCTLASYTRLDHDLQTQGDEALERQPAEHSIASNTAVEADPSSPLLSSSCHINECDVIKEHMLGHGAFAEVWSGRFRSDGRRIAIKILLAVGALDDDGDPVDPKAEEDFRKECAALQRIDSPHLIKFYGFGTTAHGNGFIVTELMSKGSLEDVLHDSKCDLPWSTRVSIGLEVALGMNHLHERHMLHRDLKSANVLLDDVFRAKVCDFGLARFVSPARQVVVFSPFTGVSRLLPRDDYLDINGEEGDLSMGAHTSLSIVDARGTMTKAAGTILWMAPEVFRGDQNYTKAVDVYSFGIVLWELATREIPWKENIEDSILNFSELNNALKMGRRPSIPATVLTDHGAFVKVMRRCWAGDPADRPSFAEAARDLVACDRCA